MHSRGDGQQWSIRAEFTITSPSVCAPQKIATNNVQDESGISRSHTCYRLACSDKCKHVAYQKGNIVFTSTPARGEQPKPTSSREVHDSAYESDLLSLNSLTGNNLQNPDNRKCRSTCSIVLCSNTEGQHFPSNVKCGRINSLPSKLPSRQSTTTNNAFYDSTDPWYHQVYIPQRGIFREKEKIGEEQTSNTFYQHSKGVTGYKQQKDAAIQTSDSLQKCSTTNFDKSDKKNFGKFEKSKAKSPNRKQRCCQPSSSSREPGEKLQTLGRRNLKADKDCDISAHTSESSKKSRTVHIDVYCTDTELESSESSSDSCNDEYAATPQKVFESESVCVTHRSGKDGGLPFKLKKYNAMLDQYDCDIDNESTTTYPTKIDSYSTVNDFSSSISSIKSWKNMSYSSWVDDHDSVANFSRSDIFFKPDKLLLEKTSNANERKFITPNANWRKSFTEPYAVTKNLESTTCLRCNLLQNCEKHTPKRQNPESNTNINYTRTKGNEIIVNKESQKYATESKNVSSYPGRSINKPNQTVPLVQPVDKISQKRFSYDSNFTTEQIASRFGPVINMFKRPGHHIGPAKNPDCSCDHCRIYFNC